MEPSPDAVLADELLGFFKALADVDRLKIAGLLAQRPHTADEVASTLGMPMPLVSRHLGTLLESGMISVRDDGKAKLYSFEAKVLEARAREVYRRAPRQRAAVDDDLPSAERRILESFFTADGRLNTIPSQYTKQLIVLRRLADEFEPGTAYSEKQVNQILKRFHDDSAALRRGLIDANLLRRTPSGSEYLRA